MKDEAIRDLNAAAWAHLTAERFDQAEVAFRELIDRVHPDDVLRRWHLFGVLGGVLNMLDRTDEGTEMYRQSLVEAQRLPGASRKEVDVARYTLGNQYLIFGDPRDALEVVEPPPAGAGHLQCLLHSVAAEALWKLGQQAEARVRAQSAIESSPTDERRSELSNELRHILRNG